MAPSSLAPIRGTKRFLKRFAIVHRLYNGWLHARRGLRELPRNLGRFLADPAPLRLRLIRALVRHAPGVSFARRIEWDAVTASPYAFCVYHAAQLAAALGQRRISVIEFGVAGGRGLIALEGHARAMERELGVTCEIYGFDIGSGLPTPRDHRDLPYHWRAGFYRMDRARLEARLTRARLVIGDVAETCYDFFPAFDPAPVGCCLFDLDFYSSTVAAFRIFEAESRRFLPRVYCYFDDVIDTPAVAYNEFTGELLAIREFNDAHVERKIAKLNGLVWTRRLPRPWNDKIYVLHDFLHPDYGTFVGRANQQRYI